MDVGGQLGRERKTRRGEACISKHSFDAAEREHRTCEPEGAAMEG